MMDKSIVITGGNGMLAQALAKFLRARAGRFAAVGRGKCDITCEADVAQLFREYQPTLLFNCAAHTKVDLCENEPEWANAVNGSAVGALARACKNIGAYFVHFSTDAVFDGSGNRPYRPEDPVGPVSSYARSKLLGEQKLQESAPDRWMIVRTAWLFGENGRCFPRTILDRARSSQSLRVVNDQCGSPTYAHDLAEAVLQLVNCNGQGIWHIVNSGQATWFELASATLEEFGLSAELTPVSTEEWLRIRPKQARRTAYSVLDTERFVQLTGRPMRHWREALRAYRSSMESGG